ncbi:thiol-disulfide oxidoreductase DCC family protein [Sphingomonas faeni]|uniref:thiol-disulfide oxidoreductase DCC family protein n=1 Tax=Sphingomonas faeni TaxID=185950 RepID=UPI00334809AF
MSRVTVWHDGNCPLCRREIAIMRRLDRRGRINFVDATGAADCPLDRSELLARFHAMEDGTLLSGAAAFAAMWRAIPVLRPIGLLARHRPVLGLLERAYLRFLKVRPRLQRWFGKQEAQA